MIYKPDEQGSPATAHPWCVAVSVGLQASWGSDQKPRFQGSCAPVGARRTCYLQSHLPWGLQG